MNATQYSISGKGRIESILFDEANKQTGGHFVNNFNQSNMDDDVSIESETLLPDLEQQQAAGTQADSSDGMSCLTDPTSPNHAFTLPQISTRMNPFPPQLPQQAARNVEEVIRRNKSLESENSEEDEEHDFGQGNNGNNEYIDEDPFMNPEIDGHVWQVTETSTRGSLTRFHRFLEYELQSEYFKSKTAVSSKSIN